jgi:1,2-diacylglycerol 3-alpha-glucosyltransferase
MHGMAPAYHPVRHASQVHSSAEKSPRSPLLNEMYHRKPLKILFYLNVILVAVVLGYKAYLNFFLPKFEGIHSYQIERINERLEKQQSFSFAVVGNINNSIGIFQHRMIPILNSSGLDFLISAGNAVSGGGEDKYQALFGTLSNLTIDPSIFDLVGRPC